MNKGVNTLFQELNDRGFYVVDCGYCGCQKGHPCLEQRLKCDQCSALSINGIACHELGCPNRQKAIEAKRQREWEEENE